ncbi:MAG: S49 family peptidase [Planctomycetes bacterium]|nr:S49 family peptidase [Planctomycetota bacterium]
MLRFFRDVFASTIGVLLAGVLLLSLFLNGLPQAELPTVPEKVILSWDPSLPIVDNPTPLAADAFLFGGSVVSPLPLERVRAALRAAASDDRIVGLELTGSVAAMGWSTLTELRREVQAFTASGKPVLSNFANHDENALYLASAGELIYLPPLGEVEWNGFAAEIEYLSRAFEKVGIEVQITRVGKYKSAVEPYLTSEMSPESREQIAVQLRQVEEDLLSAVVEGRELEGDSELRVAFAEGGLLSAERAQEIGLVDGVRYRDEVAGELRAWTDEDGSDIFSDFSYASVSLADYLADPVCEPDDFVPGATVAVIYAEGEIVDGGGPDQVAANELVPALADLRGDDEIAAVVLRINSPGGSASASEAILREVEMLAGKKPLVVSMGDWQLVEGIGSPLVRMRSTLSQGLLLDRSGFLACFRTLRS